MEAEAEAEAEAVEAVLKSTVSTSLVGADAKTESNAGTLITSRLIGNESGYKPLIYATLTSHKMITHFDISSFPS